MKYLSPQRALGVVCALVVVVVVVRFYHMWVTGFMVSDESLYYESIVLQDQSRRGRELFATLFYLFFAESRTPVTLIFSGIFYTLTWAIGSVFMTYLILSQIDIPEEKKSLVLLSLPLFPVFTIMFPLILTETMAYMFGLVGIYFAMRFQKSGSWYDALFSSLGFVAASRVREPYLLFPVVNLATIVLSRKRTASSLIAYLLPLVLFLSTISSFRPFALGPSLFSYLGSALFHWGLVAPKVVAPSSMTDAASVLYAFLLGMTFGLNPIFAVLAPIAVVIATRKFWRQRNARERVIPLNGVTGLGAYLGALMLLIVPAGGLIPQWTSTAIRASHSSLSIGLSLGFVYQKMRSRTTLAMLLILLAVGATQLPLITTALQSNLTRTGASIDRLSLSYRAPYYRLYILAQHSGKTIVFALNPRGALTYLSMLPNAQVETVPANLSAFSGILSEGWDTIYLYDSYYTLADLNLYPQYYAQILMSRAYPGYAIQLLWTDGESYAFKMTIASGTPA